MASKPDETTQLDCPVCHEDYADPKILPCSHLTCYRCVVSLLRKTVAQGGCPVCGAPIAPPTSLGQGDFVTLVDALPTDLLMVDMVQSKELLGNSNVCCICENDIEATSYCFDCCIKLCKTCAKGHGKYPAFQDHVLEDLKKITVQSLVASHRPKCYSHSDRPAELYCCAHNKLICCECATDSHGACGDKKKIPESATLKRAELRERAQRLKDKERALSEQVSQIKEQYSAIRAKVKDTFDDLQHAVERRHQEINTKLQEDELATMASLTALSNYRSALTSNAGSIQHLVTTAPDAFLLGMLEKLALRLDHLEFQSRATGKVKAVVDVNFKPQTLALVKKVISRLGHDDARQMLPATEAAVPKPQAPSPVAPRDEEKAAAPDDAEQMVDKTHLKQMVDKTHLKQMVDKTHLKQMVDKTHLKQMVDKTHLKQMVDKTHLKQMINGQWSPVTPEGKKQYDHEFLLKPQASLESRKPRSLSDMPEMADPQRQDVCKTKKNRKELNKKSKEGSDMDAFYDTQASPESTEVAEPEQTEAAPTSAAVPAATVSTVSPPATVEATEADDAVVEPPQQISPAIQVNPDPEPAAPQPQPEAPAPVPPVLPPEVMVEEPPKEEKAATPAENGIGGDAEPVVDKTRPKHMINGVQLNYKEGQWSPANPEGKKQYDREFLLKLQANPESRKPPSLPDMPEIMVDPRMLKIEDFQKAQALAAGRTCPDFTPGFFKSTPRLGGPRSVNKRGSQQGLRGGQGSQGGEQQHQEITLHKSENVYKLMLFQKDVDADDEAGETQVNDAKETKQVLRTFKSILSKLTPEKYKKLSEDVLQLNINTEERLSGVTDLVFERAIADSKFVTQYAFLCRDMLKLPQVPKKDKPNETLTFHAVLLTKCQKEFESNTIVKGDLDRRRKEPNKASDDQKTMLVEELKGATAKAHRRSMGNIRFIGELYRLKMLTEDIMHDCISKLLKIRDDDSIECLTKLLETIGKDLDHPKAKQHMDQYFAQFEKMTADMSKDPQERAQSKGKESKDKLCTRVKFSVLKIIDMRKNNWVIRKIHDQNKPSTLGEIHQKARMEQQEQQFLNSQPRMDSNPQSHGAKGKGRGSMQGDTDGWNTVPAKPVRQQIDAAKLKLTKTNVDEITLTLGGGNKFSSWGWSIPGGGSRSQEQEKSGNRDNALNSLNDSDGRRGYGRSPARGDSRGGGRMGGDRDRQDRDRDFRSKPASRSSMEAERERAVASTRNMLGAGAASNPSSRNSSRDNSRSRDTPPSSAPRVPSGPDASQMNAQELERRLTTIAEELHSNQNMKDVRESISEISHLDHSVLVMTLLEKLVEKAGKTRKLLGQMLYDMIKEQQMSIDDLIKGIAEFLQDAEDLELNIPKIWDNLAEVFASLLQDSKVLPLHFLQACMQPLVSQGNKKEAVLAQKILKTAAEYKSKDAIQAYWAASGLKFSDFGCPANFYLDMNKPVPGRVAAPGLGQAPQTFSVPRAQHQPYGQLVADAQDQQSAPMAWNPPGAYYLPTANQNMRQPRMQGMNNGQVPGSNLTFMTSIPGNLPFMTSGMTPPYNGNQGLQFVQNPSGQFMQYSQPRMPFPTTMQQQAQMSFVQPYGAPASGTYPGYYPMQIPNTSRPSSVGPQGAGGAVPKQTCNRKMLSLTDPNTGEDLTEKVFKPPTTEEVDQNAQEVQEHRNAVTIEFATKVAMLAGDKKDKEGEVSHNVQLSAPAQSAKVPILPTPSKETDAAAASVIEPVQSVSVEEQPVLNGEPDQTDNVA